MSEYNDKNMGGLDETPADETMQVPSPIDAVDATDGTNPTPPPTEPKKPHLPKPAIAAIAVVLLAGLGLGGAWLAGAFDRQPEQGSEVVAVDTERQDVTATVAIDAPNWGEGSSPFVVHFDGCCAATEDVDFYHAVSATDPASAEVTLPAGRYEVSYVSAINPDGSIYVTPDEPVQVVIDEADDAAADATDEAPAEDAATDAAETPEADAEASAGASTDASTDASADEPTLEVGGSFEQVPAEDVTQDDIDDILGDLADAVEKGDETLSGDAGQAVVDTATDNAGNAPNVDKDEVEQAGEEASGAVAEEPAQETQPSQPSGGSSGNSGSSGGNGGSASKPSGGNSGSSSKPSGGGSSQPSKPQHQHNWVAQTTQQWVQDSAAWDEPVYETVTTTVYHAKCDGCGASTTGSTYDGAVASFINQHTKSCGMGKAHWWDTTETSQVKTGTIHHEATGHYETVTTGYKCSGCGATK